MDRVWVGGCMSLWMNRLEGREWTVRGKVGGIRIGGCMGRLFCIYPYN